MKSVGMVPGDRCWCYTDWSKGELVEGKVVFVGRFDGYVFDHYVVEFPTSVDPVLLVRCPLTVTDDPEKPIGFYRRGAKS